MVTSNPFSPEYDPAVPIEKTTLSVTVDPVTKLEILPCPFCGGAASVEKISGYGTTYSVGCDADEDGNCYGYQSLTSFDRRSDAIKAWNRRAPNEEPK